MTKLGASKVALSSFSNPETWRKSGRYKDDNPELFHLRDRKGAEFLLSPTHEEEITGLAENAVSSYKQLPLLLYQITRKYRDEPRPRQGLLRTREFLMKDLYTFDASPSQAMETYQQARDAYKAFFDELRVPYLVADADSGSIGGNLSHEYHVPTANGEDTVISCESCAYAANEELARSKAATTDNERSPTGLIPIRSWYGITKDRSRLIEASVPQITNSQGSGASILKRHQEINQHVIKSLYPDLDLSIEDPLATFTSQLVDYDSQGTAHSSKPSLALSIVQIYDYRISRESFHRDNPVTRQDSARSGFMRQSLDNVNTFIDPSSLDLARIQDRDECPKCGEKSLKLQQAVELGHTFYLGDRYSQPMDAKFATSSSHDISNELATVKGDPKQRATAKSGQAFFQMGCHGIGISRIIAAVADSLSDKQGLIWPRVIAPFEAVILSKPEYKASADELWDVLSQQGQGFDPVDAVLDDRDRGLGWKLKDADLIGFPVVVVLGSTFAEEGLCEISIRRLGLRDKVAMEDVRDYVCKKLAQI
ncbi:MAG: hypothetical protein Q9174_000251 [Haloplaca sp. 1 TL-2023]